MADCLRGGYTSTISNSGKQWKIYIGLYIFIQQIMIASKKEIKN